MTKCPYRADKECNKGICLRIPIFKICQLCLMGQQSDEMSLLTREIMNISINRLEKEAESIEESLCRQTVDRYEELAKKYPKANTEERLIRDR